MKNFWYILFGIGAVVIILLVVILVWPASTPSAPAGESAVSQNQTASPQEQTPSAAAPVSSSSAPQSPRMETVAYTASGFSPNPVTIHVGDTVTFMNNSLENIRVSSDPHPTHTGYPTTGGCVGSTFDSCAPIASGASWNFTFGVRGLWGYHNHFNPSQRGTVIVE